MAKMLSAFNLFETVVCVFVQMTMTHESKDFNFKNRSDYPHHSFKPENNPLSLSERCFRAFWGFLVKSSEILNSRYKNTTENITYFKIFHIFSKLNSMIIN